MKKIFILAILIFILLPVCVSAASPEESDMVIPDGYTINNDDTLPVRSGNVLLYSEYDGRYLYRKNSEMSLEPASTVKTSVGIMIYEKYKNDLDREILVTAKNLDGKEGLSLYIEEGETLTVRQLLFALLMYGANDAAVILAHTYMEDEEGRTGDELTDFISLMNERAAELGCTSTVYKNVTGLHARGATTSLKDVITLASYAASLEGFTGFTSRDRYIIDETSKTRGRIILSRNHLVSTYRASGYKTPGVTGMSYGSTDEMGECLVVSAEYSGRKYFIAIMGGYTDEDGKQVEFDDAIYLLEYARTAFGYKEVLKKGAAVTQVNVKFSSVTDSVTLIPTKSVTMFLPNGTDIEKEITYRTVVYETEMEAPVYEGYIAGELTVVYNGEDVCTVPLALSTSVSQSRLLYLLDRTEKIVKTPEFIAGVIAFFVLLIIYGVLKAVFARRKLKRRKKLR